MTTGAPAPAPAAKPADHVKTAGIMLAVAAVLILVGTVSKSWIASPESDEVHMGPRGIEACMDSVCVDVPTRGLDTDIEVMMMIAMISGFASAAAAGVFGGMALARRTDWVVIPPGLANLCFALAALSMTVFLVRMIGEKGEVSWAGFAAIGGVVVAAAGLMTLRPHLGTGAPGAHQQARPMQPIQPYGSQPYQQSPYANQSQPMQPQPYANQSQPMQQPYANQSQPMQPQPQYGSQPQHGSQPYQQPQHGSQPYQQPQHGSQPYQQPQMAPPHTPPPQQQAAPSCPRCGTQLHFVGQYQRWFCPREQQYV